MSKIDEFLKNEKVEWKKLGEVSEVGTGKSNTNEQIEDGEYPFYVRSKNIKRSNKYEFYETAIVIPGEGGIGEVFHYVEGRYALHQRAYRIHIIDDRLITKFVYHYMLNNFKKYIMKNAVYATVSSIRKPMIENFEIPIPSIETQEKIVKTLDKFTNYVTELQAELQARTKQYEYYRDMLLSEEYLNKISSKVDVLESKDYEVKFTTLGEIAQINRGASPRPITKYITDDTEGISWIKIGDIGTNSKYVTKTAQKITIEGAKKSRILKKGDFIMSNSMSYGRPYILDIDGAIHDGWASISEFHNTLDSDFLYYYLTSSKVQNYWKGKINSSSVSNLNSEIIRSLPIPVIDKELQKIVAKILDKFQSLLADTKGLLPQEIEQRQKQYEYYREKLLTFDVSCAKRERESISI